VAGSFENVSAGGGGVQIEALVASNLDPSRWLPVGVTPHQSFANTLISPPMKGF
jgi:hypothetical protein